jgi:hypothetical protein
MATELRRTVEELSMDRIPWATRWRLSRHRRRHGTGLLMYTIFRVAPRMTMSRYWRVVFILEGKSTLCSSSPVSPGSKWVSLAPGKHRLEFVVSASSTDIAFVREFRLTAGQIIVAGCRPSYSFRPFNRNPPPERWYVTVIDPT